MGLKSRGELGVKAQLKKRFPGAFRAFETLVEARDASQATRADTFACLDGNVIMMATPNSATTFDAVVAIVTNTIKSTIATASVVIVVFDDPSNITMAKVQEQLRRDSSRASTSVFCSSDMQSEVPTSDEYTAEDVAKSQDIQALLRNRPTRYRFIDEVCRAVLAKVRPLIDDWKKNGFGDTHIVFDGVDARGADRPIGEPRVSGMVSDSEEALKLFSREFAIGEGDLKLAYVARCVRNASVASAGGIAENMKLSLCSTIDTDSFAIELIEEVRRAESGVTCNLNTLLCMRERASKRGRDDDHAAYFTCCDIALLHAMLQRHMWGRPPVSPTPQDQRAALTLLISGWAMCGCDFVDEVKPMRSDVVFEVIGDLVRRNRDVVQLMAHCWKGNRADLRLARPALSKLVSACSSRLGGMARINKQSLSSLDSLDEMVYNKTFWTAAYWNSVEFKGNLEEFGFYVPFA